MSAFLRDLRYACRVLVKTPAFSLTAIATLALVIGANVAVFSLADRILLRPLPYPTPERLALVDYTAQSARGFNRAVWQDGFTWEALRDHAAVVDRAVFVGGSGGVNLVVGQSAAFVRQQRVGAGFFRVLGVPPLIGREFSPEEDAPKGPAVAVLSYSLWKRVFNGDASILGKSIRLRGEPHEVIGVMPEHFVSTSSVVDLWTPVRPSTKGEGGGTNYQIVVRIPDGATWAQAEADVRTAGNDSLRYRGFSPDVRAWLSLTPMQQALVADVTQPIVMLGGGVALVLTMACVNLAALLLSRGASRAQEIATRLALGGSRGDVIRQLMAESLALALFGGAAGVFVSYAALAGLQALGGDIFEAWLRVGIDARALGITAVLSLAASFLFGLVPAWHASRFDVQSGLRQSGRSVAGGRHWLRRSLIVGEVALGVTVLVNAALLTRTVINLRALNPGFEARNLLTASVSLQDARYTTAARINRLFDDSLERLARAPGVESAAVSLGLPYERILNLPFTIAGSSANERPRVANVSYVTPRYFETLRIPLERGRLLTAQDGPEAPAAIVINEAFVRLFLANQEPLGLRLRVSGAEREIVGVVGDVQQRGSGFFVRGMMPGPLTPTPQIYMPAAQTNDAQMNLVHTWFTPVWTIRASPGTGQNSTEAAAALRRAIAETDPQLPVAEVRSMAAVMDESMGSQRLLMTLVGALACAAMLLAAIGIYGLIAHSIAERTREIGIRMALGATTGRTIRAIASAGVALAAAGVAIGALLSYYSVRLVQSFLWGVSGHDPLTFAAVSALFLLVAGAASLLPALRILRLQPAITLRA